MYHGEDELIRIKGERLDWAASIEDYEVEIGESLCELSSLSSNEISCRPPSTEPKVNKSDDHTTYNDRVSPQVKVRFSCFAVNAVLL